MDPKQAEYLRDIRDFVLKIYENQQRQDQNHAHLTQQVESMQSNLHSQDQRLESLNEEMSSLTMLQSPYIPTGTAGDTETAESLTEKPQTSSLLHTAYSLHEIPQTEQSSTETSQVRSTSQTQHGLDMMPFSQTASSMKDIQTVIQTELAKQTKTINAILEQERYFLKEQLEAAQRDILARLDTFQDLTFLQQKQSEEREKEEAGGSQQTDGGEEKDRESQTFMARTAQTQQSCCTPEKFKSEFESVCRELETSIRAVTRAELAWLDSKITEQLSPRYDQVNAEIRKVVDKVDALDKTFCMELQTKIDGLSQKQSEELDRKVNDLLKKQSEELGDKMKLLMEKQNEELDRKLDDLMKKQSEELDKKLNSLSQNQSEKLDDKIDQNMKKLSGDIENVTTKLSTKLVNVTKETTKEVTENVRSLSQQQREELGKLLDGVVQETKSSVSDLARALTNASKDRAASIVEQQKANMATCIKEFLANILDHLTKTCEGVKTEHQTQLNSATKSQTSDIMKKITETMNDCQKKTVEEISTQSKHICNKLYGFKLQMFQFTGKECQLVRDGQQRTAGVRDRKTYVCHFYVERFKDLIKSEKPVRSYLWSIDQYQTSFQGKVFFKSDGDLSVWLNQGRKARELGLEPRSGPELKVRATVTDLSGTIEKYCVGEVTARYDENNVISNGDWGWRIGFVSCQKLLDLGFASKEKGYERGAILIVYEIQVL